MKTDRREISNSVRIIWAIAVKDMGDALRNKTTISVVLGVTIMMLTNQLLPLLLDMSDVHRAIVFDPGESQLIEELGDSEQVSIRDAESREELELLLTSGQGNWLGLTIPADLDQIAEAGESIELDGYTVHWMGEGETTELRILFEQRLTELAGTSVSINTEGHAVYPPPDSDGRPFMVSMYVVLVIIMVCGAVVPYLMIEEKESHTLDAMLVSPASYSEVVIGKALAGSFFGLVATAVVLAFNQALVVHWGLAFVATICGTLFAVAVGLLLGTMFDNPQQMGLWMSLILLVLLVPVFLSMTMSYDWPEVLRFLFPRVPTSALAAVIRFSLAGSVPFDRVISNLAIVVGSGLVLLAVVVWLVRRMDR
jgi:ABC-2 type transport system permease protein